MKASIKIAVFILLFAMACSHKTTSADKQRVIEVTSNGVPELADMAESDEEEIITYLKHFQSLVRAKDKEAIISETEFPLLGDCIYYMIWGDEYMDNLLKYEGKIDSAVFSKSFDNIFSVEFSEFLDKLDLNTYPAIEEIIYQGEKDKEGRYYLLSVEQAWSASNFELLMSYIDPNESINEHSVRYHFKKINGKYKLYLINCAG